MSPEIFSIEKPVRGVFSLEMIRAIVLAGKEMGVPVIVKAKTRQKYQYDEGGMGVVSKGCAYIEIGSRQRENLSDFWKRVDEIKDSEEK